MAQRVEIDAISDDELRAIAPQYEAELRAFMPADSPAFSVAGHYLNGEHERYAIHADEALAGFAIVSRGEAFRDPDELVWWMDEFFVRREFRRDGVGSRAATLAFDTHPGRWEVGQLRANEPATAFWRNVIGRYTGGRFEEFHMDDHRWSGPVQYFTSGEQAPRTPPEPEAGR